MSVTVVVEFHLSDVGMGQCLMSDEREVFVVVVCMIFDDDDARSVASHISIVAPFPYPFQNDDECRHTISADNRTYTFDDGRMRMMLPSKVTIPKPIGDRRHSPHSGGRRTTSSRARVAKTHYFAIGGTLLGAVRQHGTLPWDMDVDLAITKTTYDALV